MRFFWLMVLTSMMFVGCLTPKDKEMLAQLKNLPTAEQSLWGRCRQVFLRTRCVNTFSEPYMPKNEIYMIKEIMRQHDCLRPIVEEYLRERTYSGKQKIMMRHGCPRDMVEN